MERPGRQYRRRGRGVALRWSGIADRQNYWERDTRPADDHGDLASIASAIVRFQSKAARFGASALFHAGVADHLEKIIDRFEDVANRINGVLVEHL